MAMKPPPASSEAVRNTMLANRSTDTGPEKAVRGMLREAGHPGYRLHWRIDDEDGRYVCRPDIKLSETAQHTFDGLNRHPLYRKGRILAWEIKV